MTFALLGVISPTIVLAVAALWPALVRIGPLHTLAPVPDTGAEAEALRLRVQEATTDEESGDVEATCYLTERQTGRPCFVDCRASLLDDPRPQRRPGRHRARAQPASLRH